LDYLYLVLVKIIGFFIRLFGINAALLLGRQLGTLAYYTQPKRRRVALKNIKMAFAGKVKPAPIARRAFQNLGMNVMELLYFPKIDHAYIDKYITTEGFEHVAEAKKQGKGVIFLASHMGNWELLALCGALIGYPSSIIARKQKFSQLDNLLNRYRSLAGSRIVPKGMATRQILKDLKDKKIVSILADQDAGKNGVMVNFFGRMSSTAAGAIQLAQRVDAVVIPAFTWRKKGPYHHVEIGKPLDTKDEVTTLTRFNLLLEKRIRQHSWQWLWQHKRWKTRPRKEILILNDGKIGHLNQSQAVATAAFLDDSCRIIDVKFKSRFWRFILGICAIFARPFCQECLKCVKLCLTNESFNQVQKAFGDVVISCGSSSTAVNIFLKHANQARSVVVMKPVFYLRRKIDLMIVPGHDNLVEGKRVLVTRGVPNREALPDSYFSLKSTFNEKSKHPGVGVLFGGESRYFSIDKKLATLVLDEVLAFCAKIDARIRITTSRRTLPEVETAISKKLEKNQLVEMAVIANEQNPIGAIHRILKQSDIVVASAESISMVSEAASSDATCVAFMPNKKTKLDTKHEKAIKDLHRLGYLILVPPEALAEKLTDIWQNKKKTKKLDDMTRIRERLMRLK